MTFSPKKTRNSVYGKEIGFDIFIKQSSSITKQLKSLILKRLHMSETNTIPIFEAKSIENSKSFIEGWEAVNRQLRKILSLLKVLICEQTSIDNEYQNMTQRNEERIIECCAAFKQINELSNGVYDHGARRQILPKLLQHLSQNLYSYESSNSNFKNQLKKLLINSYPYNNYSTSTKTRERRTSINHLTPQQIKFLSTHKKQPSSRHTQITHKNRFPSKSRKIHNTPQYDEYLDQLHTQIGHLKDQIEVIQKDREQLKQYNILLLQNQGILPQKKRPSLNPSRVITVPNSSSQRDHYQSQIIKRSGTPTNITGFQLKFNTLH